MGGLRRTTMLAFKTFGAWPKFPHILMGGLRYRYWGPVSKTDRPKSRHTRHPMPGTAVTRHQLLIKSNWGFYSVPTNKGFLGVEPYPPNGLFRSPAFTVRSEESYDCCRKLMAAGLVSAIVDAFGTVFHHERGIRSSRILFRKIFVFPSPHNKYIPLMEDRYQCDVFVVHEGFNAHDHL
jgi:hypothetical protein